MPRRTGRQWQFVKWTPNGNVKFPFSFFDYFSFTALVSVRGPVGNVVLQKRTAQMAKCLNSIIRKYSTFPSQTVRRCKNQLEKCECGVHSLHNIVPVLCSVLCCACNQQPLKQKPFNILRAQLYGIFWVFLSFSGRAETNIYLCETEKYKYEMNVKQPWSERLRGMASGMEENFPDYKIINSVLLLFHCNFSCRFLSVAQRERIQRSTCGR